MSPLHSPVFRLSRTFYSFLRMACLSSNSPRSLLPTPHLVKFSRVRWSDWAPLQREGERSIEKRLAERVAVKLPLLSSPLLSSPPSVRPSSFPLYLLGVGTEARTEGDRPLCDDSNKCISSRARGRCLAARFSALRCRGDATDGQKFINYSTKAVTASVVSGVVRKLQIIQGRRLRTHSN